jgi:hypothetical protein
MRWNKTSGSWERIPWPQVFRRIRAMYRVEALDEDKEVGVGRLEEKDERILRPDTGGL